jgi:CBS domain-containing protein
MSREVVLVPQDMDVWTLAKLFSENEITGAPVVDKEGKLVGVVSQTDIVAHLEEVSRSRFGGADFYNFGERDGHAPRHRPVTAQDLMSPNVISAPPEASVPELSRILLTKHIHRVIITDNGHVRGIVTTSDLLKQPW